MSLDISPLRPYNETMESLNINTDGEERAISVGNPDDIAHLNRLLTDIANLNSNTENSIIQTDIELVATKSISRDTNLRRFMTSMPPDTKNGIPFK